MVSEVSPSKVLQEQVDITDLLAPSKTSSTNKDAKGVQILNIDLATRD